MSRRARQRQDQDQELSRIFHGQEWQQERDSDEDEVPEREDDPAPSNTFH
jgi:hypothetical protein